MTAVTRITLERRALHIYFNTADGEEVAYPSDRTVTKAADGQFQSSGMRLDAVASSQTRVGEPDLIVPWSAMPSRRRRHVIPAQNDAVPSARPMRIEARKAFGIYVAKAHRRLDELIADPACTTATLANSENCSERSIRMTLSLAFLAPDLVKAAVEGHLPRGFGIKRLIDLPMAWNEQWSHLGLIRPAPATTLGELPDR